MAVRTIVGVVGVVTLGAMLGAAPARTSTEQYVDVSVVDEHNAAVKGLGVGNIGVKEDGVRREVLRVERAPDPQILDMRWFTFDMQLGTSRPSRIGTARRPTA